MDLETGVVAAAVGLLGTVLVEILRYRLGRQKDADSRAESLEDSQRELIALLQAELRATRVELGERDKALSECKREVVGLLEQLAGQVRAIVDRIERKVEGKAEGERGGG